MLFRVSASIQRLITLSLVLNKFSRDIQTWICLQTNKSKMTGLSVWKSSQLWVKASLCLSDRHTHTHKTHTAVYAGAACQPRRVKFWGSDRHSCRDLGQTNSSPSMVFCSGQIIKGHFQRSRCVWSTDIHCPLLYSEHKINLMLHECEHYVFSTAQL